LSGVRTKKTKVSVTLASDLLAQVDRYARRSGLGNRSHVIELWLRRASQTEAARQLAEETATYYESLTELERDEDAAWARVSTNAFGDLGED
jgi:metal-responsive CopG/Arc/MetJ family transcriptional regulator